MESSHVSKPKFISKSKMLCQCRVCGERFYAEFNGNHLLGPCILKNKEWHVCDKSYSPNGEYLQPTFDVLAIEKEEKEFY